MDREPPLRMLTCTARDLKARAMVLAETGDFDSWEAVAGAVERADRPGAIVRITADRALRRLLTEICDAH